MRQDGFTFVEVIVVLGILSILATLSYFFGLDSLRGYQFHAQKNEVLSMLQVARQKAVSNEQEAAHGVRLESKKVILFQDPYVAGAASNSELDLSGDISITAGSLPMEIVFDQLSAATTASNFTLQNSAGKSLIINVNNEGAILW